MTDINLIPEEAKKSEDLDNIKSKLTLAAVAILALTAISAIVALAFFSYFVSQKEDLDEKHTSAAAEVNKHKSVEELLVVTKDKASTAQSIINSRVDYINFYRTLGDIIPTDVSFENLSVGRSGITFTGVAGSSAVLSGLESALKSTRGSEILTNVDMGSFSGDESGIYRFSVKAEIAQ